ncbi:hypothetical protein JMJ94_21595 [Rhodovulum visakhapatnamense]|uniref:hypothetical protein n=1 Tax=Rhodovulum visakhapatnamense TaxID=364297 RepID=UPI001922E5F9|nr:hypothetical protein [Rhodovulum visakhapatnamense]MBL3572037.1 hypothetical protein [Rhodovulum visakhapatnamense]
MIGPVTATSVMTVRKEQTEQQTATQADFRLKLANARPVTPEELGIELTKGSGEFTAILARSNAEAAWMESAEGKAWQAEQRAKQDAQPVELAVYKGGQMVGFMAGGFTAESSIAGFLPRNWDSMSIKDLSQVFRSHGFKVVTAKEGLSMNHGQAADIMNPL